MRVLADFHHDCLYESLALLFEDRFGWELYRPIGMDWYDLEYWNLERRWHGDAVARQYLEPWSDDVAADGYQTRLNKTHGRQHRMLTVEQARDLRPDIVISTVAHNHEGMARFAKDVGATFGLQIGNVRFSPIDMAEDRWDLAAFGLVSTLLPGPVPKPHVVYHQEFSLEDFRPAPPPRGERFRVASFVQCFPENPQGYAQFRATAERLPEMDWQVFGSYGQVAEDQYACGNLSPDGAIGDAMRAADVAWHTKQWSDGFGHIVHNWAAVGRPIVGFEWYYRTQLAGPLWQEGVTTFDITDKSVDDVAGILRRLEQDEDLHLRMSEAMAARFREVVSFDQEATAIRELFGRVLP